MSILSSISRIASRYAAARARYRTERFIHALPAEVQKDIGWPQGALGVECYPCGGGALRPAK